MLKMLKMWESGRAVIEDRQCHGERRSSWAQGGHSSFITMVQLCCILWYWTTHCFHNPRCNDFFNRMSVNMKTMIGKSHTLINQWTSTITNNMPAGKFCTSENVHNQLDQNQLLVQIVTPPHPHPPSIFPSPPPATRSFVLSKASCTECPSPHLKG